MKQTVFGRIITFMLIVMMITGMLPANVTAQPSVSEQLSEDEQSNASEKVDSGTTYLIKWVEDNNSTATIIYENIMDEVIKDLEKAFFMSPDSSIFAPAFILTNKLEKCLIDYSMLVATAVGSGLILNYYIII